MTVLNIISFVLLTMLLVGIYLCHCFIYYILANIIDTRSSVSKVPNLKPVLKLGMGVQPTNYAYRLGKCINNYIYTYMRSLLQRNKRSSVSSVVFDRKAFKVSLGISS